MENSVFEISIMDCPIAYSCLLKLLFITCFFSASVHAQGNLKSIIHPDNNPHNLSSSKLPEQHSEVFKGLYGYLYIGDDIANSNSDALKTVNYKGGGPFEWGIGVGIYLNDLLSVEGTFEYYGERYERKVGPVLPGTFNNVIQAGGIGFSITALLNHSWKSFHIYSGFGVGYFNTGLLVTAPLSGLFTVENAPSDKWLPGFNISAGIDYRLSKYTGLGLEIKHRKLKADFGSYTNGEVDFGSTWLLIVIRAGQR